MSIPPKRHAFRQRQNEILGELAKGMQESLDCQEIHTEILQKKASKKARRKEATKEMINGTRPIRALVADSGDDVFEMARDKLGTINGTTFEVTRATSYDQVASAIQDKRFDVILLDCHSFLDKEPFALIRAARKRNKSVPVIVYGPEDSHDCDSMALKAGASDYLIKDDITARRLEKSIRYCLCKNT